MQLDTHVLFGTSQNRKSQLRAMQVVNISSYTFICSFIMCKCRVGNGGYSTFGVTTDDNIVSDQDNGTTTVQCFSNHTTSFAVLVDVAGGLQVSLLNLYRRP